MYIYCESGLHWRSGAVCFRLRDPSLKYVLVCGWGRFTFAGRANKSSGPFLAVMSRQQVVGAKLCSELQTICEKDSLLECVRASTRVLSVVWGAKEDCCVE